MKRSNGLALGALVLAVAFIGLAGCGQRESIQRAKVATPAPSLPPCPPDKPVKIKKISVNGNTATITINPDPRDYPKAGAGLHWILPSGYSFPADGIVIPSPPAGAASTSTGIEYQWCFGQTTEGTSSKYTIKFYADNAPATVFVCDPTIISLADLRDNKADDGDKDFTCTAP